MQDVTFVAPRPNQVCKEMAWHGTLRAASNKGVM